MKAPKNLAKRSKSKHSTKKRSSKLVLPGAPVLFFIDRFSQFNIISSKGDAHGCARAETRTKRTTKRTRKLVLLGTPVLFFIDRFSQFNIIPSKDARSVTETGGSDDARGVTETTT